jgi:GNAT superfamily N-acetyltransferase
MMPEDDAQVEVIVRDAVLSDMSALAAVFRAASLANEGDRPNLLAHPDALEYGDEWVRAGITRVAEFDGRVVGFVTGVPNGDVIELEDLFVDPVWMRHGIATVMMADLVAGARRTGAARVEVSANQHALAFYESAGFVAGETVATRWDPAVRMRLVVDAGRPPPEHDGAR